MAGEFDQDVPAAGQRKDRLRAQHLVHVAPTGVEIVSLEELPLAYLTTPAVRVRVKAAGRLKAH